jgi:hypothetical protein
VNGLKKGVDVCYKHAQVYIMQFLDRHYGKKIHEPPTQLAVTHYHHFDFCCIIRVWHAFRALILIPMTIKCSQQITALIKSSDGRQILIFGGLCGMLRRNTFLPWFDVHLIGETHATKDKTITMA